jgi:thiol:disulfide interchange protein DsbD
VARRLLVVLILLAPTLAFAQGSVTASLQPLVSKSAFARGELIELALKVTLPEGLHAQSNKPRDPTLIPTTLTFEAMPGFTVQELVFPKSTEFKLTSGDALLVFEREFVIGVRLLGDPRNLPAGPREVRGSFRYQPCNDVMCFRPITMPVSWPVMIGRASSTAMAPEVFGKIAWGTGEKPGRPVQPDQPDQPASAASFSPPSLSTFHVEAVTGGYLNTKDFLKFVHDAEAGVKSGATLAGRSPIAILLLVFLGGLALNLTPCVLPMIPINLAIIGAGAAHQRKRGFLLGSIYGAAMAVVYGALGLIVILTAGTFGGINASPWFNVAVAVLFVVLGLAMFDVGAIDFSRWSSRIQFSASSRGSFLVAFAMGAVAALLAGACVAPVVIQVVVFASDMYASGSEAALALPFVLGLGMALPWPIAGAGLSALPKPGAWMVKVKYVFGAFILAMAAYYGYLAYGLFANRFVDKAAVEASAQEKMQEGWYASLDDGLRAAKVSGKPVFLDMWATWCKNCLTMDKTTLAHPDVKAALDGYIKIKFQAEDLDASPAKEVAKHVGAIGLPTYAILKSR